MRSRSLNKKERRIKVALEIPEGIHDFLTRFASLKKISLANYLEELIMTEVDWILEGPGLEQLRGEDLAEAYGLDWKPLSKTYPKQK